jgi:hypothetical protein
MYCISYTLSCSFTHFTDVSPPSRKGLITNLTETIQKSAQNVISTLYKTEGDSQVD